MSSPCYLLDTNICIYIAKHRPAQVRARFAELSPNDLAMSVITYGELHYGAEKSQSRERASQTVEALRAAIRVLELAPEVGETYGQLRSTLERQGTPIGNNDLWIAAHALTHQLVLVTNNVREFERVADLKIENWAE